MHMHMRMHMHMHMTRTWYVHVVVCLCAFFCQSSCSICSPQQRRPRQARGHVRRTYKGV